MSSLLPLMIGLPLGGSLLNGLILRTPHPRRAGVIATLFSLGSFLCALVLWTHGMNTSEVARFSVPWFSVLGFSVAWGFQFDVLTSVMALVVTGIGTVIHLYSIGYMSHDSTPSRYFAYLNLFLFNMLTLITADNLVVLFVGWEGVGLCSYLLIGYWYQDLKNANAGMKAFIVNRIGDAGFLLGVFLIVQTLHTVNFSEMAAAMTGSFPNPQVFSCIGILLFVGAMGKSAQIPLYVWLPDAMAGPTPVSALIHAATMVTAGVYLVTRMNFLYIVAPDANQLIGVIGAVTAVFAATIAVAQNDIKKVLAYSTVSQLGLMFVALGAQCYFAAVFHLMTHAFFKALLFLGAGSVIHALEGEQDITKMGGLKKTLPWTHLTFAIGTLALAGIPPLAGFFSKDTILYGVLNAGPLGKTLWALASFASFLTAFYMARLYTLVFWGEYRGHAHAHESPSVMLLPLVLLAIGSCLTGFLGMPELFHLPNLLERYLEPVLPAASQYSPRVSELTAMLIATGLAIVGVTCGFLFFSKAKKENPIWLRPVDTILANKYWVDELYQLIFVKPFESLSLFLAKIIDVRVIDAAVLLPSRLCRTGANFLSMVQMGTAQFYLLMMLVGAMLILWVFLQGTVI
jgi:NADH-quinone oxidoreductase subunit L